MGIQNQTNFLQIHRRGAIGRRLHLEPCKGSCFRKKLSLHEALDHDPGQRIVRQSGIVSADHLKHLGDEREEFFFRQTPLVCKDCDYGLMRRVERRTWGAVRGSC